ncbi:L-dopachrome tautomerase yellow-f2-like [Lutzomyia longipalpis]|uniref:L-dopachrome tautomerase yellow-f2-like n=1 Tax=Lutzomyia longipalpis TaxID=7200 RepID=UPI00248341C9|nr:L-dopachrome tautomerase yellow-f2-like [Lutzomyia longipalpis]
MRFLLFLSCVFFQRINSYPKDHVEEVFQWKKVEFENLPQPENSYVGPYPYYIPENVDVTSAGGYHPASGLFLTITARFRPGIPTSFGAFCVHEYKYLGSSPKIWGFPNYEMNAFRPEDFAGGSLEENQGSKTKNNAEELRILENPLNATKNKDEDEERKGYKNKNQDHGSYGNNPVVQIPIYSKPTYPVAQTKDNTRIISVFYTIIDEKCNRALFMDNGQVVYYRNTTYRIQKPAILVVDLPIDGCETRNFPIFRRSEIPRRIAQKGPDGYMAPAIDYQSDSCDDFFLYIPNGFYNFFLVYDYKRDEFWAFDHESFLPVVAESFFVFRKTFHYDLPIGAFAVSLGFPDKYGDRLAYYTQMAGTAQFSVSTRVLKNRRKSPENYSKYDFRIMGYRGSGHQAMRTAIDYTYGVMFYSEVQSTQIRCWNIHKPLIPDNIVVVFQSKKVQMGIYIAVDSLGYLWFHSSHIPIDYTTAIPLNLEEVNSRTFRMKIEDAIRGTVCEN